jgi:hypothetical protein
MTTEKSKAKLDLGLGEILPEKRSFGMSISRNSFD